ncbi:hypothetical protein RYX36_007963 [Vicia faba]
MVVYEFKWWHTRRSYGGDEVISRSVATKELEGCFDAYDEIEGLQPERRGNSVWVPVAFLWIFTAAHDGCMVAGVVRSMCMGGLCTERCVVVCWNLRCPERECGVCISRRVDSQW